MKKIVLPKNGGKTDQLIWQSSNSGDYIVCRDYNTATMIQRRSQELGVKIPFPITFYEFLRGRYFSGGVNGFLVDDVDALVIQISKGVPINAITLRSEEGDIISEQTT